MSKVTIVYYGFGIPKNKYVKKNPVHCMFLLLISEDYRIEEKAVPVPGDNELLVKVEAVGICAGDSKCWAGAPRFWGERGDESRVINLV
jgi:hypothetical protein